MSRQRNLTTAILWFVTSFIALVIFWFFRVRGIHAEEQFSELSTSAWMFHPHFIDWFTKPFSLYRMDYPEWNIQYRSFIRPTECLHYYLLSLLFRYQYSAYLIGNYFYQAGTCALTYYIAADILKLDRRLAHLFAFLVFVSPGYGQQQMFMIGYAVDPLAGFLTTASVVFFLRKRFIPSWILLALAVGAKEPAWPMPIVMAAFLLFALKDKLPRRLAISVAFLSPLVAIIALRAYAFGMAGALTSDAGGSSVQGKVATSIIEKLAQGLGKWPFGVLVHSQQYYPLMLSIFKFWGYAIDAIFWITLFAYAGYAAYRLIRSSSSIRNLCERVQGLVDQFGWAESATVVLAAGSLIFPLRFAGDPRYGAPAYPLLFLTLGMVLSLRARFWARAVAVSLLASIGIYGLVFRISDVTHGREVFRAEWQLTAAYIRAIQSAGSHPLFVVDDATGGEINSEALQKAFGPDTKVVRVNDLYKDRDCMILPESGDLPLHLAVTAQWTSTHSIHIHSEITGCGGHNFLGVPRLPEGELVRSDLGYKLSYVIDPRSSPQPALDERRTLDAVIENAPQDTIIIAPDLAHRSYQVIPIS